MYSEYFYVQNVNDDLLEKTVRRKAFIKKLKNENYYAMKITNKKRRYQKRHNDVLLKNTK